jgi:hypothetical protein
MLSVASTWCEIKLAQVDYFYVCAPIILILAPLLLLSTIKNDLAMKIG